MSQILMSFGDRDRAALGNIWRITAKKSDFYLDPLAVEGAIHLSVHGPNEEFSGHRFHVKVDRRALRAVRAQGDLAIHGIGPRGFGFEGVRLSDDAYLVARIRWDWHLQRAKYRTAARTGASPDLKPHQTGIVMSKELPANSSWDVDLVVSFLEPFWPPPRRSARDDARLGPLRNEAGMWLTATSYLRSLMKYPTPAGLRPPTPKSARDANRVMGGGPGDGHPTDCFWFVETITSREVIDNTIQAQQVTGSRQRI